MSKEDIHNSRRNENSQCSRDNVWPVMMSFCTVESLEVKVVDVVVAFYVGTCIQGA